MKDVVISLLSDEYLDGAYETEQTCLAEGWSRESIKSFIGKEDAVYLVALKNGLICGIAGMYIVAGEGQIMNVAVREAFRRQGIGRQLLDSLIFEGKKRGAAFFTLEVSSENQAAIRLYEGFGFKEAGRRKKYYKKSDAILMTLDCPS